MKRNQNLVLMVLIMLVLLIVPALIVFHNYYHATKTDGALSNEQIMEKAQICHRLGMSIQMVYDDECAVYAVKCVNSGFTGDGRKKK